MKHLTIEERAVIESMLNEEYSVSAIARKLNRSTSTISREIKNHTTKVSSRSSTNCKNFFYCKHYHVCGSKQCKRKCRECKQCISFCEDYIPAACERLMKAPYVCNGCQKAHCVMEKHYYKARPAQTAYTALLKDCRTGFSLTEAEIELINAKVSPLIKQGLSPYHIVQTLGYSIPVSESTLRRMISNCQLDARNIDLRNQVKRKPRKRSSTQLHNEINLRMKEGHRYEDFLAFQEINDLPVVEMDCVEGKKEDSAVLLTLHFVAQHMQIALILNEHTCNAVAEALDKLEFSLGKELFAEMLPLLLTDNGHEFSDRERLECSIYGGKRTTIFYCEPNRSDEKPHCERNHVHIRYIIPKGTSLETYTQADITLIMNHINSFKRKSLRGQSPYDIAMKTLPEDFFILLGLEQIPPEQICLTPSLVRTPQAKPLLVSESE